MQTAQRISMQHTSEVTVTACPAVMLSHSSASIGQHGMHQVLWLTMPTLWMGGWPSTCTWCAHMHHLALEKGVDLG
jgi:hypothetical protein